MRPWRRANAPCATWLVILALHTAAAAEPIKAISADALGLSWGVCGRPGGDAAIASYAAMMRQIGTRAIRTPVMTGGISAVPSLRALNAALLGQGRGGPALQVTAIVTAYLNDPATTWPAQRQALLTLAGAGLLQAIEGPNEINNAVTGGGAHGPADSENRTGPHAYPGNFAAWSQALGRFRHEHTAALAGTMLLAPSIASGLRGDYAALPNVSGAVDAANVHFYAGGGRQPSLSLPPNLDIGSFASVVAWAVAAQRPGGPVWVSESGATTSGIYARDGMSQARYIANQIMDAALAGVSHIFIYQLIDGSGAAGDTEGNFGLFHHDGTPKPAALMLGRLQRLLRADGAAARPRSSEGDPAITLTAAPEGTHALVLRRADGVSLLAVWDEPPIDDGHGNDAPPPGRSVVIDLGRPRAHRVDDLVGAAQQTEPASQRITVSLHGAPVIVELAP